MLIKKSQVGTCLCESSNYLKFNYFSFKIKALILYSSTFGVLICYLSKNIVYAKLDLSEENEKEHLPRNKTKLCKYRLFTWKNLYIN